MVVALGFQQLFRPQGFKARHRFEGQDKAAKHLHSTVRASQLGIRFCSSTVPE